ncbi:24574_t:CDS:2, partial [Gigaspora rosea]
GDYKTTWNTLLPAALFAYHLQLQKEEIPEEPLEQSLELHIGKITEQLHQQRLQAQKNIQEAQKRQKEYHDN